MGKRSTGDIHLHGPVAITGGQIGTGTQIQVATAASPGKRENEETTTPTSSNHPIRILHLSDFHFRPDTVWSANPLLVALASSVADLRERGLASDMVAITGDVAFSGRQGEYELAEHWIREQLLPAAGITAARLLLVPGNHDVDRTGARSFTARALQDALLSAESQQDLAEVLQDADQRTVLTERLEAWRRFSNKLQPLDDASQDLPWWSRRFYIRGVEVHVTGLCSAMLCRGDDDHGRLLLGLHQIHAATAGAKSADLSLALMHHPLSFLAEWDARNVLPALRSACGALLRGHLHQADPSFNLGPHHDLLELAAGAAYERAPTPLSWQLVELDPFAGKARVHLFTWQQQRPEWVPDRNQAEPDGVATLPLRRSERKPPERE